MEAGYQHRRPRYTRSRIDFGTITIDNITDDDKDTLFTFETTTLGNGADSFDWQNPSEIYGGRLWDATTAYVVGSIVRPTIVNGHSYKCTTTGTSDSAEPSWPTYKNETIVDGTITWTENTYNVALKSPIRFKEKSFGYWTVEIALMEI